jgi:hypothetical protein
MRCSRDARTYNFFWFFVLFNWQNSPLAVQEVVAFVHVYLEIEQKLNLEIPYPPPNSYSLLQYKKSSVPWKKNCQMGEAVG